MSIKELDLKKLKEWLGADGAFSGLLNSHWTNSQLLELAANSGFKLGQKINRHDILIELIMSGETRLSKSENELFAMSKDELTEYFLSQKVSRIELTQLLKSLEIETNAKNIPHFREFAASEISDLGMYKRIAQGDR